MVKPAGLFGRRENVFFAEIKAGLYSCPVFPYMPCFVTVPVMSDLLSIMV